LKSRKIRALHRCRAQVVPLPVLTYESTEVHVICAIDCDCSPRIRVRS
jgi:hypothetical protein